MDPNLKKICFDPYNCHKKKITASLREVTDSEISLEPKLQPGAMLCISCRKKLFRSSSEFEAGESSQAGRGEEYEVETLDRSHSLEQLNESLTSTLGVSPVEKRKLETSAAYGRQKVQKLTRAVSHKLQFCSPHDISPKEPSQPKKKEDVPEMIQQLKEKFSQSKCKSEQVQILTVLPKSWSVRKLAKEFSDVGCSNYMARKAKHLVDEGGILSIPNPRAPIFPPETIKEVAAFYKREDISRLMPGKKDFVSVKKEGSRVHEQKYLVLSNLKEVYQKFKEQFPHKKISFSKFAELRPKECVLAGASGTHAVCVCTTHQNVKLMISGAKLGTLTNEWEHPLHGYKDCLDAVMCDPPTAACSLGSCDVCSSLEAFKDKLHGLFSDNLIDDIQFKQWVSTDRSNLETVSKSAEDFVEEFCEKLDSLRRHDFIAKQQSSYCKERKEALEEGEFLAVGDFAENYSFVLQDAAQGFHWNNSQATLHPWVCYFKENEELKHVSMVVISDCMSHDTAAVHLYQKQLVSFLENQFGRKPVKIIYFSDGSAAQYKNCKNFFNLCNHKDDFGIGGEWHFFATSHGKGPCDGVGGTVKRLAARASLQRPYNDQIMTPRQLFEFASEQVTGIHSVFVTKEDWELEVQMLEDRFCKAKTVVGTQKLHCFIPLSSVMLEVKEYSAAESSKQVLVTYEPADLEFDEIRGFVTAKYDDKWYLGCVLQTFPEDSEVKISFLEPAGPAASFSYPRKPDILIIGYKDVLTLVDPATATGRTYQLKPDESEKATKMLKSKC